MLFIGFQLLTLTKDTEDGAVVARQNKKVNHPNGVKVPMALTKGGTWKGVG